MTNYDRLMDSMVGELFTVWQDGHDHHDWNEDDAKEVAKYLLEMVEEFQASRIIAQWRASD